MDSSGSLVVLVLMVAVFYFLLIRPQQKRVRAQQALVNAVQEGDEVMTTGGIFGTVVEVDHPTRGKYLTVGNPIKLSDSPCDVQRSPLLGEHTEEILRDVLGYSASEVTEIKGSGAITPAEKGARAEAA